MRKNKMMRAASALLVAVLLTTSTISGTFAKYVTTASGTDTARVAKWGVDIDIISGAGFANQYQTHDGVYSGAISVKSIDDAKVVAPGTSSEDVAGDVTFKITGQPEVAVKIDIEFDAVNDICLAAGTYLDPVTADDDTDEFTFGAAYYPVKFTLKNSASTVLVDGGNLQDIEDYFANLTASDGSYYAPNALLDETYTLTWAWAFNGTLDGMHSVDGAVNVADNADTYLANEVALQPIEYTLEITVTQVH